MFSSATAKAHIAMLVIVWDHAICTIQVTISMMPCCRSAQHIGYAWRKRICAALEFGFPELFLLTPQTDITVPRLDGAIQIVGVGQYADAGQCSWLLAICIFKIFDDIA